MELYLKIPSYIHVFVSLIKGKQNNGTTAVLTEALMRIRKFSGIPRCVVEWAVLQISPKHPKPLVQRHSVVFGKTRILLFEV